jgi:protein-tyrosine sulfotransferase
MARTVELKRWLAHAMAHLPIQLVPNRPTFIIGCARSGTSILKKMLQCHESVAAFPSEANHLWHPTAYPWVESDHQKPPLWSDPSSFTKLSIADWSRGHGDRLRREFAIYQRLRMKPVFLNKSAMIAFMLPEVLKLFPEARFIHIVRDGRPVALSYARKVHGKMLASEQIHRSHGFWCSFDELLQQMAWLWKAHLDEIDRVVQTDDWVEKGIYFECRYEDFCSRPRELVGEILGFMDLPAEKMRFRNDMEVRDMNYKISNELSPETIASLTATISTTLESKGYSPS